MPSCHFDRREKSCKNVRFFVILLLGMTKKAICKGLVRSFAESEDRNGVFHILEKDGLSLHMPGKINFTTQ
jgi:hypothetical protein